MRHLPAISGKSTLSLGLGGLVALGALTYTQGSAGGPVLATEAAAQPTTNPSTQPTTRPEDDNDGEAEGIAERVGGGMGSRLGDRLRGKGPDERGSERSRDDRRSGDREESERVVPTEEEWEQTVEFLAEHAPQRLAMYERFAEWARSREEDGEEARDEGRSRRRDPEAMMQYVRSRIFQRVQSLQQLADRDPELHTFALRQFELEDEIYGIMAEVRKARESGDSQALEEAEVKARDAMYRYARNTFAERESRIERLSEELEREQKRLERDRDNIDEIIRHLEKRFGEPVPPSGERRRSSGERRDPSFRDDR